MAKLNGKKRYIAAGGATVTGLLYILIQFVWGMNTQVVATEAIASENKADIAKLERLPEQMAALETGVKGLKESFEDFRGEQRVKNQNVEGKLDKIYDAIMSR